MLNITGLRNPYDYANPVRTDEYFAGRGAELAKIDYVLGLADTTRPVGYLALYGERAAGKTSLLNMTEKLAANRDYLVVRVNLVPTSAEPALFFATVYEELIGAVAAVSELASSDGRKITPRVVRRIVEGGTADDDFPLEFPENLAHAVKGGQLSEMALRNDMRYLMELVGRPVILLIDEAQLIADRPDVLSMLRTLGMRLHGYVLVLAGTPELVARINEVFDFLLRQFEFIKVERYLELPDVVQCMERPLQAIGLNPGQCFTHSIDGVVGDLMRLTDGNPYEIQLFGHVMFAQWQIGSTGGMDLTARTIDDVQAAIEVGNQHQDQPLVSAVRRMSDEELQALNIWCSSLESATLDEIRFACHVSGRITLSADQLDRYLDGFIRDGLIELVDNTVRLIGGTAEHIYARLSAAQRLDIMSPILVRRINFEGLLSGELSDLLYFKVLGSDDRWLLRTCCPGMQPEVLERGVLDLTELPSDRKICHAVEYLHEAILESGAPRALHLTIVECSYGATVATRWICRAATDDFDLNANPEFQAAQDRVAGWGGTLRAERTVIPLRPMPEIVHWLVDSFVDSEARYNMAIRHADAGYAQYQAGDIVGTMTHLDAAFRLSPHWRAANNLAYLHLVSGDYSATRHWAKRAVPLGGAAGQRSLSRYNAAIAAALDGEWEMARELLAEATTDLAHDPALDDHYESAKYLIMLTFESDHVSMHEEEDVNLADAIAKASDVIELAERFGRLRGSA